MTGERLRDIGLIEGAEMVVAVFGYWPTSHDAEILWLRLDRQQSGEKNYGPTVDVLVHTFEMTSEVNSEGYYVLQHHVLVHLRFMEAVEIRLDGFNHQNALMGLDIADIRDHQLERIKFEVRFDSAFGADATFQCRAIEVVSVMPCSETGEQLA